MRLAALLLATAASTLWSSPVDSTSSSPPKCRPPCVCEILNRWTGRLRAICTVYWRYNHESFFTDTFIDSSVDDVDFTGSTIDQITSDVLRMVRSAKVLQMSAVGVREIRWQPFELLENLWSLDLSNNRLLSVDRHLFSKNLQLRRLSLRGNTLHLSQYSPVLVAPQLEWLDLSRCSLNSFSEYSFRNLTGLRTLLLNDNLISTLPASAFAHLTQLRLLSVQRNELQLFPSDMVKVLPKLIELQLDDNRDMEGPVGPLDAPRLQRLSASRCSLESVPPRLLDGAPMLRHLTLSDNLLHELWLIGERHQLVLLDVMRNPIECDCALKDTWLWATGLEAKLQCGNPPTLWENAGLDQLDCAQGNTTSPLDGGALGDGGGGLVELWVTLALLVVIAATVALLYVFRRQLANRFFNPETRAATESAGTADALPLESNNSVEDNSFLEEVIGEEAQGGRTHWLD